MSKVFEHFEKQEMIEHHLFKALRDLLSYKKKILMIFSKISEKLYTELEITYNGFNSNLKLNFIKINNPHTYNDS